MGRGAAVPGWAQPVSALFRARPGSPRLHHPGASRTDADALGGAAVRADRPPLLRDRTDPLDPGEFRGDARLRPALGAAVPPAPVRRVRAGRAHAAVRRFYALADHDRQWP